MLCEQRFPSLLSVTYWTAALPSRMAERKTNGVWEIAGIFQAYAHTFNLCSRQPGVWRTNIVFCCTFSNPVWSYEYFLWYRQMWIQLNCFPDRVTLRHYITPITFTYIRHNNCGVGSNVLVIWQKLKVVAAACVYGVSVYIEWLCSCMEGESGTMRGMSICISPEF